MRSLSGQTGFEYSVSCRREDPTLLKNIEDPVSKRISPGTVSYLVELPDHFYRIGFDRLRERLQLTSHKGAQNATIKKALEQLDEAGFFKYTIEKNRGDYVLVILSRNKKVT